MIRKLSLFGNPYIGVYIRANDNFAIVPMSLDEETLQIVAKTLEVEIIPTLISKTTIIGSLLALISLGALVTVFIEDEEFELLKKKINVEKLKDRHNAAGNIILISDKGALVHDDISKKSINLLEDVFDVEVLKGTIAGIKTVGMCAVLNRKGIICHPKINKNEENILSELFNVPVNIGTANFGVPFIGACIVANNKGVLIGDKSTPVEITNIQDSLKLYD